MIRMNEITKTFRVAHRSGGMKNALKSFVKREYDEVRALDGVSFEIPDGGMVGLIGPNGAGKSSAVKVMSGILTPDSGECTVNGRVPWKERKAHVSEIGVVFGQRSALWWDVPVVDSFELLRDIYSVDPDEYRKNLDELTETLALGGLLRTPTRQLSLGQRMRCEIAASLLHSPKTLFLDEPTIGLDASSKLAVRSFVARLNHEHGTTVLLTTHDMQDVEALTERILLIGKGHILLDGQLADLKKRFAGPRVLTVEFSGPLTALPPGVTLSEGCALSALAAEGLHRAQFILPPGENVSAVIAALSAAVEVRDLSVGEPPIDELMARLYQEMGL